MPNPITEEELRERLLAESYIPRAMQDNDGGMYSIPESNRRMMADRVFDFVYSYIESTKFNPFDFVQPCEPECTTERHAYHEGQWDMALRINDRLTQNSKEEK